LRIREFEQNDSRKGAKTPRNEGERKKFESRNPKFETISNDPNITNFKQTQIGFEVLDFPGLGFILAPVCFGFRNLDFGFSLAEFVSVRGAAFDIRISDFVPLASWRDKYS
jgi:hypothetical protein